jgi:MFS family permease
VAQSLAPLLFAIPVFDGIAVTLVRALGVSHPDLGFTTAINSDAEALYLGQVLYQDPADGYTGQLYTPLFPFMVSVLHHVTLWPGWTLVLSFVGSLSLVGLTAWLAYRGGARNPVERLLALVGALGVGAIAWWFVSALPLNLLYDGRSDHLAWAFALFGLVLLARGVGGSPRVLVAAALLLSAAFWAKQTTLVASAAAVLWLLVAAALGAAGVRRAVLFAAGLVVANLAVLGVLNLITDGWQFYFDFELAREHPQFATFWPSLRELFRYIGPAIALAAALAAGLAWRRWRRGARARSAPPRGARALAAAAGAALRRSSDLRLSSLLLLFTVIGIPAAVSFRLKVGSDVNQYIGVSWAIGLLAAVAYRRSRAHDATALVAAVAVAGLFLVSQRPGEMVAGMRLAPLEQTRSYTEVSPRLLEYARSHLVYEQVQSDLNVEPQGSIYPNFYNFIDLLAAGRQPTYLVDALLSRRFDAVAPIVFEKGRVELFWNIYASGAGRQEANYFWKLNEVIRAGYRPAAGVPPGFLARRPGPHPAPWMRSCFGPFRLAGVELGIRAGGGFWCRAVSTLALRGSPARSSEVHSLDPVAGVGGSLGVTLPRRVGSFTIALRPGGGRGWALKGQALPGGRELGLEARIEGRPAARAVAPVRRAVTIVFRRAAPGRAEIAVGGGRVVAELPPVGSGDLSITASRDSDVRLDFSRATLADGD